MNPLYISAYVVNFDDYKTLADWCRTAAVGPELAADWKAPDFYEHLQANAALFEGMPVTFHAPFVDLSAPRGSEKAREAQAKLQTAFDLYRQFGACSMVIHTHEGVPEGDFDAARQRSTEALLDLGEQARRAGVSLTVENVGFPDRDNHLYDLEQFCALFETLPEDMGCLIDTGHALRNGWDIPALIRRLGTRIRGYHIHTNNRIRDLHWPLSHGESCMTAAQTQELLATIAAVTPDAHIILEYSPICGVTKEWMMEELAAIAAVCGK